MTINRTPDQIRADALAQAELVIKKAETQAVIVGALPVAPRRVHVYPLWSTVASAAYEVKTKADALAIWRQFATLPSFVCKGNTTSVKPFDDVAAERVSEVAAVLVISPSNAKLEFFTSTPAGIEMPIRLFGEYKSDNPKARTNFKMNWFPLPKTAELFMAVAYAPAEPRGPSSAGQKIYAMHESSDIERQFSEAI